MGGHLLGQLRGGHAGGACGVVDLVVDVGDVLHQRHLVALVLEEALEQGENDERPRVADVDAPVHRGAAGVDAHAAIRARLEGLAPAAARVVERDVPHACGPYPACPGQHISARSGYEAAMTSAGVPNQRLDGRPRV